MNLLDNLPPFFIVLLFLLISPLGILFSICVVGLTIQNGALEGNLFNLAGLISIVLLNFLAIKMATEL